MKVLSNTQKNTFNVSWMVCVTVFAFAIDLIRLIFCLISLIYSSFRMMAARR